MTDPAVARKLADLQAQINALKARVPASSTTTLTIEEQDGVPSISPVNTIKFGNGTVTDNGDGVVSVANSGGGISNGDYGDVEVSGAGTQWTVEGLQTVPIAASAAGAFLADVLTFDGSEWTAGPGRTYSGARVGRTTDQSINDATDTAIVFNAETYDDAWSGSIHSTVTDPERLTVPTDEDGIWQSYANITFESNATGYRQVDIVWNDGGSSQVIARVNAVAVSGAPTSLAVSTEYSMAAGEWIEVHVFQTSGGALNVEQHDRYGPIAILRRIR